jgi:hypothetical protein
MPLIIQVISRELPAEYCTRSAVICERCTPCA